MPESGGKPQLNPAALSIREAAQLLSKAGGRVIAEATLQADVDAGAPRNADGTLNLVHYAAWLLKEMGRTDAD